ncbi:MAG TPA: hypothetical protein VGP28_09090 [Methylocella sp.]|jgi:hypothetical protein|nr:hypothetical protein [Methylocella sp.]
MTDHPEDADDLEGFKFASEFDKQIAEITACWSCLEYYISMSIWHLAAVYPAIGACITSQIYTLDGRLKALVSLLVLRKAPAELQARVNKFSERVRGPSEIRNRLIHDQWFTSQAPAEMKQMEMLARGTLKYGFKTVSITDLRKDRAKIISAMKEASAIRAAIETALPTLPEIPLTELHPIILHDQGHEQTRSSDKTFLLFPPRPSQL